MRQKHWVIYTSSYDRGLEHLLKMWPDVKKSVPDAELHIFYGWQLYEKFYHNNPASMAWMHKMNEMMKYEGITDHGRVSQIELKQWIEKCGVWAYPTNFGEISCISAMKAQAWGSVPCVVNYAALQTTVKWGVKVEGDIYEPETKEAFKKALVTLLTDQRQDEMRAPMMAWAKNKFSWKKVAQEWTEEFK